VTLAAKEGGTECDVQEVRSSISPLHPRSDRGPTGAKKWTTTPRTCKNGPPQEVTSEPSSTSGSCHCSRALVQSVALAATSLLSSPLRASRRTVRSSTAERERLKQASMARLWEVAAAVVVYVAVFTIQRLLRVLKSRALGRGRRKCDQFWYVFSSMAVHWDPTLTGFKDVAAMSSFLCP
jgi:hypothetical protein